MQDGETPFTRWVKLNASTANTISVILLIFSAWVIIESLTNVFGSEFPPVTGMETNVDPDDTQRVNNGIIVGLGSIALSVGIILQLMIPRNLTEQKEMASEEPIVEEEKEEFDEELVKLTKWLSARGTTTVQFFEWADVDNSGTIDMNEFADALRTAEIANLPPWEVEDLVKVMDINNDGKINLPELDMMILRIRNSAGIEFVPYVEEEEPVEEEAATEEAPEEAPAVETEEVVEEATEEVAETAPEEAAAVEESEPVAEEVPAVEPEATVEEAVEPEPVEVAETAPEEEEEATEVATEEVAEEVVEETPEVEEVVEEVSEEEKAATLQAAQDLLNSTLGVDDEEEESDDDSEEESDEDDSEEPIDQAAALSAAQDVLTNSLGLESEDEDSETEDEEEVVDEVEEEAAEEAQEEIEEPVEEKEPPKKKKKF